MKTYIAIFLVLLISTLWVYVGMKLVNWIDNYPNNKPKKHNP